MTISPEESLIEYPSDFPIKVMGQTHETLQDELLAIVLEHDPGFDAATIEVRPSKAGNYTGLTFTVRAVSRNVFAPVPNVSMCTLTGSGWPIA